MTVPSAAPVVVHHPADHPYVRHLGPIPPAPPRARCSIWDVAALVDAHVDVVHLHFGFEHLRREELARWLADLAEARIALVHTVHDLDNPHLVDQARFHDHVRRLVAASAVVMTLTPAAAAIVRRDHGRDAVVVAHPHVVPLGALAGRRRDDAATSGVFVHASTLRPNVDDELIARLARASASLGGLRVHVRSSAPGDRRRRLQELLHDTGATLEVGDRLSDDELWQRLETARVVALPYRWGTHSGLLEAAHDLGTPTIAPSFGGYADQGAHVFDVADLRSSLRRAIGSRPTVTIDDRLAVRRQSAEVHRSSYAGLVGAIA